MWTRAWIVVWFSVLALQQTGGPRRVCNTSHPVTAGYSPPTTLNKQGQQHDQLLVTLPALILKVPSHWLFLSPVFLLGSSLGHCCPTHFHHLGLQLVMVMLYLLWSGGSLEQEPEAGWEVRTLVTCNSALLNQQLVDLLGHQSLLCGSWMLFYTDLHRVICGLTHCYIWKLRTI